MPLNSLDVVFASEASVSIHHEGHMLGNWSLSDGADEQLTKLANGPCNRGCICNPPRESMLVEGGHCGR